MSDAKPDEDDEGPFDPRARWKTDASGIEQAGVVVETIDLTTPEQKKRNAEAARILAESLALAHRLTEAGIDDDDEDEVERKD